MIVSNSSPLHYLVLISAAWVLPELYGSIVIPNSVQAELSRPEAPELVRGWLRNPPPWLQLHHDPLPTVPGVIRDVGEAQAIATAMATGAKGVLLDDRKARRIAREQGLLVVGTLGVLEAASDCGLIAIDSALDALERTSFRVDKRLVQLVRERNRGR